MCDIIIKTTSAVMPLCVVLSCRGAPYPLSRCRTPTYQKVWEDHEKTRSRPSYRRFGGGLLWCCGGGVACVWELIN